MPDRDEYSDKPAAAGDDSSRRAKGRRDDDETGRSDDRHRDHRRHRDSSRDRSDRHHRRHRDSGDDRRDRHRSRRERSVDVERSHRKRDCDERKHRERSTSREPSRHHRRRSRSPPSKKRRNSSSGASASPAPHRKSRGPLPSQDESFRGEQRIENGEEPAAEKQKPNFKPTGLLAKEANTVAGTTTVLKYHEPPEARKPPAKEQWRMYVFKKKDLVDTLYICQRSVWLVGRDQKVTDLFLEHPSISKQHAVIQFRYITTTNEFGDKLSKVKPYIIDLESANGTALNGKKIEASRFVELVDGDVVTFGDSEREYVLMLPPRD